MRQFIILGGQFHCNVAVVVGILIAARGWALEDDKIIGYTIGGQVTRC